MELYRPSLTLLVYLSLVPHLGLAQSVALSAPPVAPVRPVIDDYFGTKVTDPYHYMENLSDPEVQAWMKAQNDYTRAVLARIPGREKLLARIRELDRGAPATVTNVNRLPGGLYFYEKLVAGEDVTKLYVRRGLTGQERLLVNPEKMTLTANQSKGKNAIVYYAPSPDGKYTAIGIAPGGSENDSELRVIENASGRETGDVILRALGNDVTWLPDSHSFVDGRLQKLPAGAPESEVKQKFRSYMHVVGSSQDTDPAVFGYGAVPAIDVDPRYFASMVIQPESKYALGTINTGAVLNNAYYIAGVNEVGKPNARWRKVADFADGVTSVAVHDDDLYLLTFKYASRSSIIRTDARHPDFGAAKTIVAQSDAVIQAIVAAQDALYVQLLEGGIGRLLRVSYGADAKAEQISLPFVGAIRSLSADPRIPGVLLTMTSWTRAPAIYVYDPRTRLVENTKLQPQSPYDNAPGVESIEVTVPSYDGVMVPLSIVYPKGMKRDGSNFTHLYGYGSYGLTEDPIFYPMLLALYEHGGAYAVCHVRGGGEYGEEWHLAGKGPTKPNTWRDFIACAQYLVDHKYTSPGRLSGQGGSAGSIMIGRAIEERPDLFGIALISIGIPDMLRFETTANGEGNMDEFGTVKTQAGFDALYAMSSYHHVKDQTPYPAIILDIGANDPRVDPWESAKMTARLQAASSSGKPVLLRVDYEAGHGNIGATERQFQELLADLMSFEFWQAGVPDFQPQ
jgi:prolyl oligopeptidase